MESGGSESTANYEENDESRRRKSSSVSRSENHSSAGRNSLVMVEFRRNDPFAEDNLSDPVTVSVVLLYTSGFIKA